MTKLQDSEILLGVTANSIPNLSEVVQLFERGSRQIQNESCTYVCGTAHGPNVTH